MESNSGSCKLKIPKDLDAKTPVFLVKFSNGCLNMDNSNSLKFASYRRDDGSGESGARRILVANNGRCSYASDPFQESVHNNKFNYFVGVRNKTSERMKIYNSIPFNLKSVIKSDVKSEPSEIRNIKERADDLTMNFGSKGKIRGIATRQKYAVDSASLEDVSFDDSQHNSNPSPLPPLNSSTNIEYMPPQNSEAQTIDQVYKIGDIISAEEDEYLAKRTEELLHDLPSQWKIDGSFCEYVLCHLENDQDRVKTKYLLYYNYLVSFSKLLFHDMKKKDPAPQIPEPIKSNLLYYYTLSSVTETGKTVRSFPTKMKDKLHAYILVLALLIDNYCVNLPLLQKDLKCGLPKLKTLAQALGCHVNQRKVENSAIPVAELKFPLFVFKKYKKF